MARALYIHWPFCLAKCPYCDFNSHVHRGAFDEAAYVEAYARELSYFARQTQGRTVQSIFFGGGTPSLMDPDWVGVIIAKAASLWAAAGVLEVSLEANPTDAEAGRFQALRAAGVQRLSLGLQSLDDQALALLGRNHSAAEARQAMAMAARTFPRLSADLIYIHSNGLAEGREAYLDRVRSGPGRYRNLAVSNFRVRRDGATAICDGVVSFEYAPPKGSVIAVKAHFLAVWKLEGEAWRLAAYASPSVS